MAKKLSSPFTPASPRMYWLALCLTVWCPVNSFPIFRYLTSSSVIRMASGLTLAVIKSRRFLLVTAVTVKHSANQYIRGLAAFVRPFLLS